jgi:hypothetical protein
MRQLQLFTTAELATMRDRTRSNRYSPASEEFRRTHQRHRAWGLTQRHAERLRRPPGRSRDGRPASIAKRPHPASTSTSPTPEPASRPTPEPASRPPGSAAASTKSPSAAHPAPSPKAATGWPRSARTDDPRLPPAHHTGREPYHSDNGSPGRPPHSHHANPSGIVSNSATNRRRQTRSQGDPTDARRLPRIGSYAFTGHSNAHRRRAQFGTRRVNLRCSPSRRRGGRSGLRGGDRPGRHEAGQRHSRQDSGRGLAII